MKRVPTFGTVTVCLCLILCLTATGERAENKNDTGTKSAADPASGEEINWQVISSGGTKGSSTNFTLNGTVGQTAVGSGSSTNYGLRHGYWQDFGDSTCCENRGNVDGLFDGDFPITVSDLTYLVAFLFSAGPPPPCEEEGNVDGLYDGEFPITVSDLTFLVAFLFSGGPAPPPC